LDRWHLFDGFSNPDASHACDILISVEYSKFFKQALFYETP